MLGSPSCNRTAVPEREPKQGLRSSDEISELGITGDGWGGDAPPRRVDPGEFSEI
jgi:hypothetical protein